MKFAIHAFLLAALLATAVAAHDSGVPKAPLTVTLSLSADMKSIQADVTNTGAESLDVITLHTPLSADDQGGYQVSEQTRTLTFTGFVMAYATTNLTDFHKTIAPGKTVTVLWSLSLVDFANSTGPYYASTSGIFQYLPSNADADAEYLLGEYESNKLQFDNVPPRTQTRSKDDVLVSTDSCNSFQLNAINAAGSDYGQLADAGVGALTGDQDTAFTEFFGKGVNATQYRIVTNRFYQLQGVKKYAGTLNPVEQSIAFSYSCNDFFRACKPGAFAYVNLKAQGPQRNVVYFCPLYFSVLISLSQMCSSPNYQPSTEGVFYRGGALFHEFMHLRSVMISRPLLDQRLNNGYLVYGYAASKLLATQNSARARENPDNYEFFALVEYARIRGGSCTKDEL